MHFSNHYKKPKMTNNFFKIFSLVLLCFYTSIMIGSQLMANDITIVTNRDTIDVDSSIQFSVSQPNGLTNIRWFFGDNTNSFGNSIVKTYEHPGKYRVKAVLITDECKPITLYKEIVVRGGITATIANMTAGKGRIWVMAHRGNTGDKSIPENSIAAVNACIAAGVEIIETDTHLTKDGHVVICHDATINRTTNGTGKIADLTLAQIKSYRLKDRNGNLTNESMPTLKEILLSGKNKIFFNLDYSPRTASTQQVYSVVQDCDMLDEVLFYTGTNDNFTQELFSYSQEVHPLIWAKANSNYTSLLNKNRKFFVQLDYSSRNKIFLKSIISNGLLLQYNFLSDIDDGSLKGDTTALNELIDGNHPASVIMSDNSLLLIDYLENKNKR